MALAAALGSIQLGEEIGQVPTQLPEPEKDPVFVQIPIRADGRCFFTCLYLAVQCSWEQRLEWLDIARNLTGFPLDSTRSELEDMVSPTRGRFSAGSLCNIHIYYQS